MPARTTQDRAAPKLPADPGNAKGELIAACRTLGMSDPVFQSESGGPGHAPWFRTTVLLGERELGTGEGRSKRDAERAASLEGLKNISVPESETDTIASISPTEAPQPLPSPVPIYADVLSQALLVAHERSENGTLVQVAHDAALLYRRLLQELGHSQENP